ncbi:MAG TPA: hypothetical protein VEX13_08845 [Chloroflexia bacterium]|nr:hypothetical protein [Chloroflexia bacterium]
MVLVEREVGEDVAVEGGVLKEVGEEVDVGSGVLEEVEEEVGIEVEVAGAGVLVSVGDGVGQV